MLKTYSRSCRSKSVGSIRLPNELLEICRLCLTNKGSYELFKSKIPLVTKQQIKFCTGLEISEHDGLPTMLCHKCITYLIKFCAFKERCITNEGKLKLIGAPTSYEKPTELGVCKVSVVSPEMEMKARSNQDFSQKKCDPEDKTSKPLQKQAAFSGDFSIGDTKFSNWLEGFKDYKKMLGYKDPTQENCNFQKNKSEETISLPQRPGKGLLDENKIYPEAPADVISKVKRDQSDPKLYTILNGVTGNVPLVCQECNSSYSRLIDLIHHHSKDHGWNKYYCEYCCKSFAAKNMLERHMQKHLGIKPFACPKCGKRFTQKISVKRHIKTHLNSSYPCKHCSKILNSSEGLKSHITTQHSERTQEEIYKYKCNHCDKSFCYSSGLSRHLHSHTGIYFNCKICNQSFQDASCLKRHSKRKHFQETNDNKVYVIAKLPIQQNVTDTTEEEEHFTLLPSNTASSAITLV